MRLVGPSIYSIAIQITPIQRRNLASIAKVLQFAAAGQLVSLLL